MVAPIDVRITGDATNLSKALGGASKSVSAFGGAVGVELPGKIDIAVKGVKVAGKAIHNTGKAAKDAAAEEKIFADAMAAAGVASEGWAEKSDAAINASMKMAFTDTETRKAIVSMSAATGDLETALTLLTTAQDIARLSGGTLEQASDAVAKAYRGQDTALVRMIPGLEQGATAQETIANASKLAAGAAETYGTSSEAAAAKAKIGFSELQETVGSELGPALHDLWETLKPLLADLIHLAGVILPPVISAFTVLIGVAGKVAGAIGKIVDMVQKLIDKIKALLAPLDKAISKLKEIDLNPFNRAMAITEQAVTASTAAAAGRAAPAAPAAGPVTINIYGDPAQIEARVIRALRGYQFRNGAGSVFNPERM